MINRNIILTSAFLLLHFSCKKEEIKLSTKADDTFYLKLDDGGGFSHINVKGNTASNIIVLIVHGGPGGDSYSYREKAFTDYVEPSYAVAYWDQRLSGASQASNAPSQTIEQHGRDMKKVILLLKNIYGSNTRVFVYAHSWGGIVTSQFLTNTENESYLQGVIYASAAYSFPLQDSLIKPMIIKYGNTEIGRGRNTKDWQKLVSYCQSNLNNPITLEQSIRLNRYAFDAIKLMKKTDLIAKAPKPITDKTEPTTAILFSSIILNPKQYAFAKKTLSLDYRGKIEYITLPLLVITGKFDFAVPPEQCLALYNTVASTKKLYSTLSKSTHNLEEQDSLGIQLRSFINTYK